MVESYPGSVYLSQDKSLGVFVRQELDVAAKNIIAEVLAGASTTGPQLDRGALRSLSKIVGQPAAHQAESGPPVVLSHAEMLHLEVIIAQSYLRQNLPDRVRRVCPVCAETAIEDPAYLAQREEEVRREYDRNKFISAVAAQGLDKSGHPFEALLRFLYTPPKRSLGIVCPVCGGRKFDRSRVTFCPRCHNLRDEFLLVQCPGCDYDFTASVRERIWTTGAEALQEFNVTSKYSAVTNAVRALGGHVRQGQISFLTEGVTAQTTLLGVARCGLIDNCRRDTVLLITSDGIRWCSKRHLAGAEGRSLKWAEVAAVPRVRSADGDVRLNLPDGRTVTFGFIGAGKALGIGTAAGARALDAKAIWRLIAMTRG